jgi:hypothetical protein
MRVVRVVVDDEAPLQLIDTQAPEGTPLQTIREIERFVLNNDSGDDCDDWPAWRFGW